MSSLLTIANKAPIVSTFSARALRATSSEVRDAYTWHAATYVEQPALAALRQSFIDAVKQAKTPKACLIAPFGYGKTASAIGLWSECSQAGLLVIPPISCSSFTELAGAIYSWLTFTLTESANPLAEAHDKFLVSTAEILARHDERAFGIPFDQGLSAIRDKLERGYLDFDDVSINLLAFLEQATAVVCQAGYGGLVVMIDEFQQLLGNANKGVLVALRQLIWGLRTRQLPFGLVLTMDPDTERTLSDRAGDILHRIKDDGLYLDIRHIYDRDFPARLWQQYSAALHLSRAEQGAIDNAALEALGQLCERDDLSNGPRTVINILQQASARWTNQINDGYSPIDLIDDLLNGTIRFDGDRGAVPALVADLLNFPYFQRSVERTCALKLIAAFPRGCPEQIAAHYNLALAWRELNDDLRGEIVTETEEGLALIELQRVGQPANRLNILLRRYWMQITDQQLFAEDAARVFRDFVLPLLFPAKVNDLNGWGGLADIELTIDNTYAGILEGTASTAYPMRRIAVLVRNGVFANESAAQSDDVDLSLDFSLDSNSEATSSLTVNTEQRHVIFNLALARTAHQRLHGSIGWIAHYLSPHPISAAVVLSLLRYLSRERLDTLPERDRARIEDTLARLREWLLVELLPPALFEPVGFVIASGGAGALKEFMFQFYGRRWPDYQPLIRFPIWATMLDDYAKALSKVAPAAQLGQEPIMGSKAEIAELFGQKRHAGFDSYARQYGTLLQIETWQGSDASIRLVPHSAELHIAECVRARGFLAERAAYTELRQTGFAAVEATQLIRLTLARGLVWREAETLSTPSAPTAIELNTRARTLRQRATALQNIPADLHALLVDFDGQHEQAMAAAWRLDQAERSLVALEAQASSLMSARRDSIRGRVMSALPQLAKELSAAPAGHIEKHLAAALRSLNQDRGLIKEAAESFVRAPVREFVQGEAEMLASRVESWVSQAQRYERWVAFAQQLGGLQVSLERLGKGSTTLDELHEKVESLIREARSVQSEIGLLGFAEVDRLQSRLTELLHEFDTLADDRRVVYNNVAATLMSSITKLLDLPEALPVPTYNPVNDEHSFQALQRSIAATVSRTIALMEVSLVENPEATGQERLALGKLRKLIRDTARIARDPAWLLNNPDLSIRNKAADKIRNVRTRIDSYRQWDNAASVAKTSLVVALSGLPSGSTEVVSLFTSLNGTVPRDEFFNHLLQLHEVGILRLVIDIPDSYDS